MADKNSQPAAGKKLGDAVHDLSDAFAGAGIESPVLNARILVEHATGLSSTEIVLNPDRVVLPEELDQIEEFKRRRLLGEPVYRIAGAREFYGLRFELNEDTLEPRADTETVVDAVLPLVRLIAAGKARCRVLDLGAGTGAIGVAIAASCTGAEVVATDISAKAADIANRNAAHAGVPGRYQAIHSNWFEGVKGRFDIIVSNPPYIPSDEISRLAVEVREHDPELALDGGPDGLEAYRTIIPVAGAILEEGGFIAVEIGAGQREDVEAIFRSNGFVLYSVHHDLGGIERALIFAQEIVDAA